MLLIISNSLDETANYLCKHLSKFGLKYVRFDSDFTPGTIEVEYSKESISLKIGNNIISPSQISNVWYRRPKPINLSLGNNNRENDHINREFSQAIEGFFAHIPEHKWMNHPVNIVQASHKFEQLTRATDFGLTIPNSLVTQSSGSLKAFWKETNGDIVIKPIASGYLEGTEEGKDSVIYTSVVQTHHFENLNQLVNCPSLFQEKIDKRIDIRINIIDGNIVACCLKKKDQKNDQQIVDIRRDNMHGVEYSLTKIPDKIQNALVTLIQSYKLRFAAIDMAVTKNDEWIFFEINPNGQWAWLDILGVTNMKELFIKSFKEQLK
jgi:glutathione synthase/RimK-type ligase-like ATP-grasp enzyme